MTAELEAAKAAGKGGRPRNYASAPKRKPKPAPKAPRAACADGSQPGCKGLVYKSNTTGLCSVCLLAQPCTYCGEPKTAKQRGPMHSRCYLKRKRAQSNEVPHGSHQRFAAGCTCQVCLKGVALRKRQAAARKIARAKEKQARSTTRRARRAVDGGVIHRHGTSAGSHTSTVRRAPSTNRKSA